VRTLIALVRKDILLWLKDPFYLIISLALPLVVFGVLFVLAGREDQMRVAVAAEGRGPYARQMLEIIRTAHSRVSPYFFVETTDPVEARRLFAERKVLGLITIPADFDARIEAGEGARLELDIDNSASDWAKNYRLRVDHVLVRFNREVLGEPGLPLVEENNLLPRDLPTMAYLAAGIVVLALMFGGINNTGMAVAQEWDRGTIKELLGSPTHPAVIVGSKMLIGFVQASLAGIIAYLAGWAAVGLRVAGNLWLLLLAAALTCATFVGLGVVVGIWLKRVVIVAAAGMLIALTSWIICGGFGPIGLISRTGQAIAAPLPPTYAFDAIVGQMLSPSTSRLELDLAVLALSTVVTLVFGSWLLGRSTVEQ